MRSFPTNLTAMLFKMDVKPNFTVENEAAVSTPPKVDFGKHAAGARADAGAPAPRRRRSADAAHDAEGADRRLRRARLTRVPT